MKKIPPFGGPYPDSHYRSLAARAASVARQKPRIVRLACSCGHEVSVVTEIYSIAGDAKLRAEFAAYPCGACVESYDTSRLVKERNARDRVLDEYRRGADGWRDS